MSYLLIGAGATAWLALGVAIMWLGMEGRGFRLPTALVAGAVWFSLTVAGVLWLDAREEAEGPCVREEERWQYNPATKTTMPYTYCAERGEWENR